MSMALEIFEKNLDITSVINKIMEFQKLKYIMLNSD